MSRAYTVETLLDLPLNHLGAAVEEWETQHRRLEELLDTGETMARYARAGTWRGENAGASIPVVVDRAAQVEAACTEAGTMRDLLRDARERLKSCQDALVTIIEVEAPELGVHVDARGRVTGRYDEQSEVYERQQAAVREIGDRIRDVLTRAAEEDALIAQALRDAMGTEEDRFSGVAYARGSHAGSTRS
ncbi:hypothetical protein [Streptomyces sp. RFCAC02]|uniref:hypothetical protein n=1 Tax=Streptomyces sp. RFCAC02 TaxID=2499143 RepID=UPI0010229FC4|nr:hypothetical protein [Streptomyces sp. RFCAC02]